MIKKLVVMTVAMTVAVPFIFIGFAACFIKESIIFGNELHNIFSQWIDKE
jgi:hypothetical protein